MALPLAEIVHATGGRTRLRFADRIGDTFFFERLAERLRLVEGVAEVRARPRTGSVIVLHEGPSAGFVAASRDIFGASGEAPPPTLQPPTAAQAELAGAALMAGLALLQSARGRVLPPAVTLLWYAAGIAGLKLPK